MSTTRFILAALLCASPAILLWDGLIALGLVAEIVAIALVITAATLRPLETGFLLSIIRRPLALAAIPAAWVLVQALPLGLLPHPMWKSAAAAIGHPLLGSISIDPGATIIALGQYLAMIAVAFLSAAVAIDRQRVDWLLFALMTATGVVALLIIAHDLFPGSWLMHCAHDQAIDCSAMGIIIASAGWLRSIERQLRSSSSGLISAFAAPCAVALCGVALVFSAGLPTLFAAGYGLVALICVTLIRRLDLSWFGITGLAVVALGGAILLLAAHPNERGTSLSLSFAASPAAEKALSQHVLDDAPLVGTGASTFLALAPAYREITDPQPQCAAATTAATFAIELGRPALWLIVLGVLTAIVLLLRDSLQRGRDWFYPAMGGSCLLAMLLMSFTNAGLLGTTTGLIIAAVLGVAFGQSKSRVAKS